MLRSTSSDAAGSGGARSRRHRGAAACCGARRLVVRTAEGGPGPLADHAFGVVLPDSITARAVSSPAGPPTGDEGQGSPQFRDTFITVTTKPSVVWRLLQGPAGCGRLQCNSRRRAPGTSPRVSSSRATAADRRTPPAQSDPGPGWHRRTCRHGLTKNA
ncbi:unnamed protein product [Prorocentrum cordatum]|uniref:Uncharacterized protein n=1 Tax=Prorocentrum cordatum TaxID=2364126 RepID=A0ABN9SY24_9DINO|nr:unnamed protein product [Polarella glacialis]